MARKLLPSKISHAAAVDNCGNACAITAAFASKNYEHLRGAFVATQAALRQMNDNGRIILAGAGAPPDSLLARLTVGGKHDRTFGNAGITYPILGRPPGGDPIYSSLEAVDVDGSRIVTAGAAAGPGRLTRSLGGPTVYAGRFALTVSRLK